VELNGNNTVTGTGNFSASFREGSMVKRDASQKMKDLRFFSQLAGEIKKKNAVIDTQRRTART